MKAERVSETIVISSELTRMIPEKTALLLAATEASTWLLHLKVR
jgi:hypothetical protein